MKSYKNLVPRICLRQEASKENLINLLMKKTTRCIKQWKWEKFLQKLKDIIINEHNFGLRIQLTKVLTKHILEM